VTSSAHYLGRSVDEIISDLPTQLATPTVVCWQSMVSCATTRSVVTTSCRVQNRCVSSTSSFTPSLSTTQMISRNGTSTILCSPRSTPVAFMQMQTMSRSTGSYHAQNSASRGFSWLASRRREAETMVMAACSKKPNLPKHHCNINNFAKKHVVVKAFSSTTLNPACCQEMTLSCSLFYSQVKFWPDLPRFLVTTAAAAMLVAMTTTTTTSWNFITTTSSPGADSATTTATTTTIGRGGGGGGTGGGGTGGPMLKKIYPNHPAERRAQDDVRQWEEDTQNNPYEVRSWKC
jgi:hypothetical protein